MSVVTVQARAHYWLCADCADGVASPRPLDSRARVPRHCECCFRPMARALAVAVPRKALFHAMKMDFEDYLSRRQRVQA